MDQKIHASFIPKKSLASASRNINRNKARTGNSIGIVSLITLIMFISVIALAIGIFSYQQFFDSQQAASSIACCDFLPASIEPLLVPKLPFSSVP